MAYQDEWDGETMVPVSALRGEKSYEQWLGERALWRRFPPRKDFVSGTTYFLIDREGCVAGSLDLRHELNQHLLDFGGHIGYGIRKEYRGRGYATAALALALKEAWKIVPEEEIYLSVHKDNPASLKVQLRNGARVDHEDGVEYYTRIPRP